MRRAPSATDEPEADVRKITVTGAIDAVKSGMRTEETAIFTVSHRSDLSRSSPRISGTLCVASIGVASGTSCELTPLAARLWLGALEMET